MNFQAEVTSFCNLTCPECPNWTMQRERTMMSLETFKVILERYVIPFKDINRRDCPPTLIMHKDGEPFLNKKLPEMLTMIGMADPTLKIDIYSHGLLLTKEKLELLNTLPNKVRLLISFHFYNHDGSTNDYTKTTALLHEAFSGPTRRYENIEIILVSHLIRPMTPAMLEQWRSQWQEAISKQRVVVHANVNINPWTGLIEEPGISAFPSCPYGDFGHWFFGATGNLIACCMDLEEEIVFGNVHSADPETMLQTVSKFFRDVTAKKLDHQVCRYCLGVDKRPAGATASAGVTIPV